MKKILTLTILLSGTLAANAQSSYHPLSERASFEEFIRNIVILLMIYMVTSFILSLVKAFLDDRLKRKIVETGTPGEVVAQLMATGKSEKKNALKWFCALIAAAAAFGIIGYYEPREIYALMVITFSLAIGFLGYFSLVGRISK
jgi:hypothetical protein